MMPTQNAIHSPQSASKQQFNIVVAGEFNAGKSSVINLLLRKEVVPAGVAVSDLPPLEITDAADDAYSLRSEGPGQPVKVQGRFTGGGAGRLAELRIKTPMEAFAGAAIHEVSVGQDGTLTPEGAAVLADADLLIWCTMGQRAWCLSEISIVETLPGALLDTAILAVTRSDYLRNTADLEKVKTRLGREAKSFFNNILMLECGRKSLAEAYDDTSWAAQGGKALFDLVSAQYQASDFAQKVRLVRLEKPEPPMPEEVECRSISPRELCTTWRAAMDSLESWLENHPAIDAGTFIARVRSTLRDFSTAILPAADSEMAQNALVPAFNAANLRLNTTNPDADQDAEALIAANILLQLSREIRLIAP